MTIKSNGSKVTKTVVRIQINNLDEQYLSSVQISHNPNNKFQFDHAYVFNNQSEVVRKLKKKDLKRKSLLSNSTFYQDRYITEFDLNWHQYPYQIEYEYWIEEEEFLQVIHWTPYVNSKCNTERATLSVEFPLNYKIQKHEIGYFDYSSSAIEGRQTMRWEAKLSKAVANELYRPPLGEILPQVYIVPNQFIYGSEGGFRSWSEFGDWMKQINAGTNDLPLRDQEFIRRKVESISNPIDKVKAVYHYLQDHTSYINITIDIGGIKSYPASYVSHNKFGDCKALTTYIKALLDGIGIASQYVYINGDVNPSKIWTDFPSQQFNHVILMVPLAQDTFWLENTDSSLPFNYLGSFTQDRYGLMEQGKESRLIRSPIMKDEDVLNTCHYYFSEDSTGKWDSHFLMEMRGQSFEQMRYLLQKKDVVSQSEYLERWLGEGLFNYETKNLIDFDRDSSFLTWTGSGQDIAVIRKMGKYNIINPFRITLPQFSSPDKRIQSVRFPLPIHQSDESEYLLSEDNSRNITLPDAIKLTSPFGEYTTSIDFQDQKITIHESLIIYRGHIPTSQYESFYAFVESINEYKKTSIILMQ